MPKKAFTLAVLVGAMIAPTRTYATDPDLLYKISVYTVAGSTTVDALTSWGGRETNPILTSRNGRYGLRGLAIKSGLTMGILGSQTTILRSERYASTRARDRKLFTIANFALTGFYVGLSVRNARIRSQYR